MLLLAITIPGLSMLLNGRIISGLIAIILQVVAIFTSALFGAGVVLWILLVIWAVNVRSNVKNNRKLQEIEKKINTSSQLNSQYPINESKTEFGNKSNNLNILELFDNSPILLGCVLFVILMEIYIHLIL
jgi:hypothetical protein